jgi:hypothetical protein
MPGQPKRNQQEPHKKLTAHFQLICSTFHPDNKQNDKNKFTSSNTRILETIPTQHSLHSTIQSNVPPPSIQNNHENENVRYIGQGEARHRKYKIQKRYDPECMRNRRRYLEVLAEPRYVWTEGVTYAHERYRL